MSRILFILMLRFFPFLASIPNKRLKAIQDSMNTMQTEAERMVKAKREEIQADGPQVDDKGKDLLTLLIKANDSESGKTAMTPKEVQGQITTFLLGEFLAS